jgi:hypothetical protein
MSRSQLSTSLLRRVLSWFSIATLLLIASLSAEIVIQGFPPAGVTPAALQYEYRKICTILAPNRPADMSRLTVEYFFRENLLDRGDTLPEWGGGGAIGRDKIVVPLDVEPFLDQNFYQITVHELTHIAINRICGTESVPRWFHEGLAMVCSGEVTFQEQLVLSEAIIRQNILPLAAIDSVNSFGKFRAELAYCQSRQALLSMIYTWGMEGVRGVIDRVRRGSGFWQAVDTVLAITPQEFEQHSRDDLAKRFNFMFFITDTYLVWLGIVILFLVAFVVTKIRNARRAGMLEEGLEAIRPNPNDEEDEPPVYEDGYGPVDLEDEGEDEDDYEDDEEK